MQPLTGGNKIIRQVKHHLTGRNQTYTRVESKSSKITVKKAGEWATARLFWRWAMGSTWLSGWNKDLKVQDTGPRWWMD
jgi:hypothetical protein